MTRRKSLKSLGDWLGAGEHSFDGSLLTSHRPETRYLALDQLVTGRFQPRRNVNKAHLANLEKSIQQFGVIEPLAARPLENGRFELLAGHMRWRAAQQAGLTEVPVIVHDTDDRTAAAIALVENLLRQDLNPIEEGQALLRLQEEFGLSQGKLAELLGISQPVISKTLRLLNLNPAVQKHIEEGRLEAGHGKVLLGLSQDLQRKLADKAVAGGWSVRELERHRAALSTQPRTKPPRDPNLLRLEEKLQERFSAPVRLHYDAIRGHGRIEIGFSSLDECDGILERLGTTPVNE